VSCGCGGPWRWGSEKDGKDIKDDKDERGQLTKKIRRRASSCRLDVTSEESWQAAIEQVVRSFGRLDVLVNSAASRNRKRSPKGFSTSPRMNRSTSRERTS